MGKFNQGILGGFTGKVGNVVGARSRGQWIYRAYQGIVKNPKTIAQTRQREQFRIFSQEITKICKADAIQFNAAFPGGMTEHSFLVRVCFNMLRAYQKYPKKPFETLKNVGLTKGIQNIGALFQSVQLQGAGLAPDGPSHGGQGDQSGELFLGLNFGNDLSYAQEVAAQGEDFDLANELYCIWLHKSDDGFYHVVYYRDGTTYQFSELNTEYNPIAKCKWFPTRDETEGWLAVKGGNPAPDGVVLYSSESNYSIAIHDDGDNQVTQVPIFYSWWTNSKKVPIGNMCKLLPIINDFQ